MHHLYQIVLRFHYGVNRLISHRRFVNDIRVLPAFDAGAVAFAWASTVNGRFASPRDIARPAPWLGLMKLSGLPLPRTK